MYELAYHCTIYFRAEDEETMEQAAARLERILEAEGIEYQSSDMELREI